MAACQAAVTLRGQPSRPSRLPIPILGPREQIPTSRAPIDPASGVLWKSTPDTLAAASATMLNGSNDDSIDGAAGQSWFGVGGTVDSSFAALVHSLAAAQSGVGALGGWTPTTQPTNDSSWLGVIAGKHL